LSSLSMTSFLPLFHLQYIFLERSPSTSMLIGTLTKFSIILRTG
jgi:hypothetical protein